MKSIIIKIILVGAVLMGVYGLTTTRVDRNVVKTIFNIPIPTPTPVNLNSEKLMSIVNDWKVKQGYQSFITDKKLCDYVNDLIINNISTLTDENINTYLKNITMPYDFISYYWNIITNSPSEDFVFKKWIENPKILTIFKDKNYKNACVKCVGVNCLIMFSKIPPLISSYELNKTINIYRSSQGVKTLKVNQELCNYGEKRLQEIIKVNNKNNTKEKILNHDGIDADIKSNRIKNYIHGKNEYGENISPVFCIRRTDNVTVEVTNGTELIESCFDTSPKHKEVLLDPIWTDVCSVGRLPFYIEIFAK